ncbi:MAG: hypothetical protein AAGF54_04900 [Pseudomonadota bacterium]
MIAAQVIADSISENFVPPLHNGACIADVNVTSDGSTLATAGYCPTPATPSNYEISYDFSVGLDERMDSIIIWANSGSIYTDGELRSFDLEVDYIRDTGVPSTLVMNGVNIGDTLNPNDPKTVIFMQSGSPVQLLGVTQIRMTNLAGSNTIEMTFRELVGDVNADVANPNLSVTKTADNISNVPVGTLITYTYVVTNTGNQTITNIQLNDVHMGSGPAPTPTNETLSNDIGLSGDSSDTTSNDGVWDTLAPFDEVTFTGTYLVTQDDIDNLQ